MKRDHCWWFPSLNDPLGIILRVFWSMLWPSHPVKIQMDLLLPEISWECHIVNLYLAFLLKMGMMESMIRNIARWINEDEGRTLFCCLCPAIIFDTWIAFKFSKIATSFRPSFKNNQVLFYAEEQVRHHHWMKKHEYLCLKTDMGYLQLISWILMWYITSFSAAIN